MRDLESRGLGKLKNNFAKGFSDVGLLRDKTYKDYLMKVEKIGTESKSHVNAARLFAMHSDSNLPLATPENRNKVY